LGFREATFAEGRVALLVFVDVLVFATACVSSLPGLGPCWGFSQVKMASGTQASIGTASW
jgi:hypothetical protein